MTNTEIEMIDNTPLWHFALELYKYEEVSTILLEAQDNFSVDINILLFSAWLASVNRSFTNQNLRAVEKNVQLWRKKVIIPIREVRKFLKLNSRGQFSRKRVKKIEIDAEREQYKIMYDSFLANSQVELTIAKYDLLKKNLSSLKIIGLNDESIFERVFQILAKYMELVHSDDE